LIKNQFELIYNEQANQSYSIGFMVGFSHRNFSLKTGLAYNHVQFNNLFIKKGGANTLVNNELFLNNYGLNINVIDQSLSFIECPILLGYQIGNKKLNCVFETGLAIQHLAQTNSYFLVSEAAGNDYKAKNDVDNNRFNRLQLAMQASVLANYKLTNRVSVFIGPIAKFHIGQYYKDEFTKRNSPIYFGANSGINFKF
jgi:hypothetical protein